MPGMVWLAKDIVDEQICNLEEAWANENKENNSEN